MMVRQAAIMFTIQNVLSANFLNLKILYSQSIFIYLLKFTLCTNNYQCKEWQEDCKCSEVKINTVQLLHSTRIITQDVY